MIISHKLLTITRTLFLFVFLLAAAGGGGLYLGGAQSALASSAPATLITPDFSVATGDAHSCYVTPSGGVKCWGANYGGGLGNNTTDPSSTPVDVLGLTGASLLTAGSDHTCAVTTAGAAYCWGGNYSGQVGDNSMTDRLTPVGVYGLTSGVSAIAAGSGHTCAIVNGGLQCWGYNWSGQLGNGNTTDSSVPVPVTGLTSGVTAVALGSVHSCALAGGVVKCWGDNYYNQLGNTSGSQSDTPMTVEDLPAGVIAIAAGENHSCAVTAAGAVKCWGQNSEGQLGNNTTNQSATPVDVVGLSADVVAIAAGGAHTCARLNTGGLKCWGDNYEGQLGDGTASSSLVPVDVSGLTSGVSFVTAGERHTCARLTYGSVKCWGENEDGQVGTGAALPHVRPLPQDVTGLTTGATAISSGSFHVCALVNGVVECWGRNSVGQLGDTTTIPRATPVTVSGLGAGVIAIGAGGEHTCAVTSAGAPLCWGNNDNGQLGTNSENYHPNPTPVSVYGLTSGVTAIAGGSIHTCALVNGGVQCWGRGYSGQLGDGSATDIPHPVQVSGLPAGSGVTQISTGAYHSCAIVNGAAKCWGSNIFGAMGNSSNTDAPTPVQVDGLTSGVTSIAGGTWHSCAVVNGAAKCWGANDAGQLGNNSDTETNTPVQVTGLESGVVAIATSGSHTCALTSTGGVKCWGSNEDGQLGNGGTGYRSLIPVDVTGLTSGVSAIETGSGYTCAFTSTGGVKCWGKAYDGQLGIGIFGYETSPVFVIDTRLYLPFTRK